MKASNFKTLKTVTAAVALTVGGTLLSGAVDTDTATVLAAQGEGGQGQGSGGQGAGQGSGGQGEKDTGQGQQGSGGQGGKSQVPEGITAEDDDGDDSDRPDWAGGGGKSDTGPPAGSGTKKGDLYGDLWVILRDENGVPILYEWVDGEPVQSDDGFPQPVDADGNLIPLDEEGHPIDESLTQEVELGRLNVGRAPNKVSDRAYDEALTTLNTAQSVTLDDTGRFTVTLEDGTEKTIDSPIENLALYVTLMTEGYLPGLEDRDELGDLDFLTSGSSLTNDDLDMASKLLAASADKFGNITVDQVAYLNSILGIAAMTSEDYVDYSSFDYNRDATYTGDITYYVQNADGSIDQVTEPIMDAVFDGESYTSADGLGIVDFSRATDDALQMIEFIHENVPFD